MVKRCQTCSATIDSGIQCDECIKPPYKIGIAKVAKEVMDTHSITLKRLAESEAKDALIKDLDKIVSENKGTKHDNGKADLSIVPIEAVEAMARAFTFGSRKYSRGNYKLGIESTRTLAAALRHIMAFCGKEENDPESGLSHLDHALAAIAMTVYNLKHNKQMDDR